MPRRAVPIDVRLVDVVKQFGDVVAVDHIDLEVQDGEFFSLLGPSGCGKTTTLRMIGGFEEPTSGLIELQGEDVTWLPPYKRNVNTVFQNYALFPHLTIYENVAFGLRRKGVKDSEVKTPRPRDARARRAARASSARKPTQISGGQAQRVALARALINRPAVLLLDEPLGALDLKLRKQMQVELKRIQQEVGITFIYVTHDQEEAMTMSDRIAVMNRGRYEQLGDPESLYERPVTPFVAGLPRRQQPAPRRPCRARTTRYATRASSATTPLVRAPSGLVDGDAEVSVGVRPEKIRLREPGDDRPRPATTHCVASSATRRTSGVSTQYQVEARSGARLTVYEQNVERATRAELWAPGEEVLLTWSPDHSFVVATRDRDTRKPSRPDEPTAAQEETTRMTDRRTPLPAELTRRRFLQGSALAGTAAFLAACGTAGAEQRRGGPASAAAGESAAAGRERRVPARRARRPAIERRRSGSRTGSATSTSTDDGSSFPTIEKFQAETGIDRRLRRRRVDDNETFFTSDLQAPLEAGQPTDGTSSS